MTTTREQALENALRETRHYVEHFKHFGAPAAVEIARKRLGAIDNALALPPSPPVAEGAWMIDPAENLPLAVVENTEDGLGVCEIGERTPENLERARLIAAAPDMLAFCRRVAATKPMLATEAELLKGWLAMIAEAKAAIARATGREE